MSTLTTAEVQQIEALVDRTSVYRILGALAEICEGKAEHISSNWQDPRLANAWERRGSRIERMAESLQKQNPE